MFIKAQYVATPIDTKTGKGKVTCSENGSTKAIYLYWFEGDMMFFQDTENPALIFKVKRTSGIKAEIPT